MRTQIAKALKARSKAVRTAVNTYNEAAHKLHLRCLDVKTVLDYVQLGQFDLLRLSRHNVTEKAWARPAERDATTAYFKLKRSKEELTRVKTEVQRLVYGIQDWKKRVDGEVEQLEIREPALAWQMKERYRTRRAQDEMHLKRIYSSSLCQYVAEPGNLTYRAASILKLNQLFVAPEFDRSKSPELDANTDDDDDDETYATLVEDTMEALARMDNAGS